MEIHPVVFMLYAFFLLCLVPANVQCADIQFTTTALSSEPSSCKNNTGVTATPFPAPAANRNANESTPQGQPQDGGGSSGSSGSSGGSGNSDSGDGASVSQSNTGAGLQAAVWGVLGAAVVGGVAIL